MPSPRSSGSLWLAHLHSTTGTVWLWATSGMYGAQVDRHVYLLLRVCESNPRKPQHHKHQQPGRVPPQNRRLQVARGLGDVGRVGGRGLVQDGAVVQSAPRVHAYRGQRAFVRAVDSESATKRHIMRPAPAHPPKRFPQGSRICDCRGDCPPLRSPERGPQSTGPQSTGPLGAGDSGCGLSFQKKKTTSTTQPSL